MKKICWGEVLFVTSTSRLCDWIWCIPSHVMVVVVVVEYIGQ